MCQLSYSWFSITGPKGDLRNYLEKLAASDNVQKFIQQNPFGQQPISYNNESWKFYLKVIGDSATCPQQEADASKSCFRKKLLVIDVSGLLADVVSLPRERYKADTILQYKADTILPGSRAGMERKKIYMRDNWGLILLQEIVGSDWCLVLQCLKDLIVMSFCNFALIDSK